MCVGPFSASPARSVWEWMLKDAIAAHGGTYGIYLLHFVPLIWLQCLIYDPAFPAFVKFSIVFAGTLSASCAWRSCFVRFPWWLG